MAGLLLLCLAVPARTGAQPAFDARELANYRLTLPVFRRFAHASRLIASATARDPRFAREPLVTADIATGGDAAEAAATLARRLDEEPALSAALFAADISARDYARFAVALIGARLAHGFVESGALRRVPPGVPSDNVAFVREHLADVRIALRQLGVE